MTTQDQILQNIIDQGHRCETTEDLLDMFKVEKTFINSEHGRILREFFDESARRFSDN